MNPKTQDKAHFLRPLLILIAIVQLALGIATALFPATFFSQMGLTIPPPDNQYMLAMLVG